MDESWLRWESHFDTKGLERRIAKISVQIVEAGFFSTLKMRFMRGFFAHTYTFDSTEPNASRCYCRGLDQATLLFQQAH